MTMQCLSHETLIEGRVRQSRGSVEVQVAHPQPTMGMPMLVPEPSTVIMACTR